MDSDPTESFANIAVGSPSLFQEINPAASSFLGCLTPELLLDSCHIGAQFCGSVRKDRAIVQASTDPCRVDCDLVDQAHGPSFRRAVQLFKKVSNSAFT